MAPEGLFLHATWVLVNIISLRIILTCHWGPHEYYYIVPEGLFLHANNIQEDPSGM